MSLLKDSLTFIFIVGVCLGVLQARAADKTKPDQRLEWYISMPWPREVEKFYEVDRDSRLNMLAEDMLARRFKENFSLTPEIKNQIERTSHFYRYIIGHDVMVKAKSEPTEEELINYYKTHTEEFTSPEMVKVQKIFIEFGDRPTKADRQKAEKKARDVYQKAKSGKSFSMLVREYSTTKTNDGIVGPFPRGKYNPIITKEAFSLKPGEISEPFSTHLGYFIFKGLEKIPEGTKPLAEVKQRIEERLRREKLRRIRGEILKEAREKFKVTVYEDRHTSANFMQNTQDPVIKGADFVYTKKDLQLLYPRFRPSDGRGDQRTFNLILDKILMDQLFRHSKAAESAQTKAAMEFIRNYHLSEAWLKKASEKKSFSEEELRKYYEENLRNFLPPIVRELSLIRVKVKPKTDATPPERHYAQLGALKKAEAALKRLKKGEDFAKVAREVSEHPSSQKGGYLGWITQPYQAIIDITASKLEPGQVSEVTKDMDSYIIVKLHAVKERNPYPFEKVRDRVERNVRHEYTKTLRQKALEEAAQSP